MKRSILYLKLENYFKKLKKKKKNPKQGLTGPYYISRFHVLNSIVDTLIKANLVIFMMQKGLPEHKKYFLKERIDTLPQ